MKNELIRKCLHIMLSISVAFIAPLMPLFFFIVLCVLGIVALPAIKKYKWIRQHVVVKRGTHGDVYFILGALCTALFFLPYEKDAFQFGMLVLGFSDSAAAIVGQMSRSHGYRILGRKKTMIGSVSFFVSTLVIGIFYTQSMAPLLFVCFLLTVIENVVLSGFDNLAIPLCAAFLFGFL